MVYCPQSSCSDYLYRVITARRQIYALLDALQSTAVHFTRMVRGEDISSKMHLGPSLLVNCCCGSAKTRNDRNTIIITMVCVRSVYAFCTCHIPNLADSGQTLPPFHMPHPHPAQEPWTVKSICSKLSVPPRPMPNTVWRQQRGTALSSS